MTPTTSASSSEIGWKLNKRRNADVTARRSGREAEEDAGRRIKESNNFVWDMEPLTTLRVAAAAAFIIPFRASGSSTRASLTPTS